MSNKLQVAEVRQIQPWLKHFLVHVVKRCALILVGWIEQVQEIDKGIDQGENVRYNHKNGN